MTAMTVRLPDDVHEWLRREAYETRTPLTRIVIYALLAYRDQKETERDTV
jgi:predicted transcriptional regulator